MWSLRRASQFSNLPGVPIENSQLGLGNSHVLIFSEEKRIGIEKMIIDGLTISAFVVAVFVSVVVIIASAEKGA
jgi:hypothetical protein